MPQNITRETFLDALRTMNAAIEEHQQSLFFHTVLQACESMFEDELMGVAIYRTDPETPYDFYTIRMRNGRFDLVEHGREHDRTDWRVSEDYLRDLANNPNKYIDHPEKLSLNWFAERVVAMTP